MKVEQVPYFFRNLKERIWFYPVLYSIFASVLAIIIVIVDLKILFNIEEVFTPLLMTSLDMSESILGIIAGAFITITTFTFSITMVVLTMYTSQYSPRVIKNFLTRKDTLQSFGIFVSGFLYTMLILVFFSSYPTDTMIISGTIGIVYILVGLVFFFRFINNVGAYIQASNLIKRLKEISYREIDVYKKMIADNEVVEELPVGEDDKIFRFNPPGDGFIKLLHYSNLAEIAAEYGVDLYFNKVIGQFVTKNVVIGTVNQLGGSFSEEGREEIEEKIGDEIIIAEERNDHQDFAFTIQKIVEVAMKGLSPGINDPNTAIQCIQITSLLLRDLSELPGGYLQIDGGGDEDSDEAESNGDNSRNGCLYIEAIDFKMLLMDTYQQIVHYGLSDVRVIQAVLKSLQVIKTNASDSSREDIMEFTDYLWRKIINANFDRLEVDMLRREKVELESI
ncbi:MAG: DUF2254 domain-containing protein [Bacillota bacterium]